MIAFDAQTTTIIIAACSGLALGVAGMRVVDATADRRMMARHKRSANRMLRANQSDDPWTIPAIARPAPVTASGFQLPPGVRAVPSRVPVSGATASASPAVASTVVASAKNAPSSQQFQASPPLPSTLAGLPRATETAVERVPRREAGQLPAYIALAATQSPGPAADYRPHLQMRAIDHVIEWLSWQREAHLGRNPDTGRWECRRSHDDVVASYRQWARARSLFAIPEGCFLNLLAKQPGIEKSRDRLKDSNGRVLRNARGTPLRAYYYTICELPPMAAPAALRRTG